jgi:hypothetical protein
MSDLFIDALFNPPKIQIGDRVHRKDTPLLGRKRGSVVSCGGWFAVISWDGIPSPRREYIADLELEAAQDFRG